MSDFIRKVQALRKEVWEREPQNIEALFDKSKGYTDTWGSSFFPTIYGWLETVSARKVFYVIRKTLLSKEVELETAKLLIRDLTAMYVPFLKWANQPEAAQLLQESSEAVGRLESKDEVSELLEELVLFLASDEASWITGACLDINGGTLMD